MARITPCLENGKTAKVSVLENGEVGFGSTEYIAVSYTHLDVYKRQVVDWSKVDKEDYLLAMERSPIKDVEIKVLLKAALTDEVGSREVYRNGIDHSYYYEGYTTFKTEEL